MLNKPVGSFALSPHEILYPPRFSNVVVSQSVLAMPPVRFTRTHPFFVDAPRIDGTGMSITNDTDTGTMRVAKRACEREGEVTRGREKEEGK